MKGPWLALGLVILSVSASDSARAGAQEDLAGLSWLAGGWRGEMGRAVIEEHWTKAAGGMMLGVSFKLTKLEGESAVFENPEHDHPKIIRYRKGEDGSLTARIEGDEGVQAFAFRAITAP